MNEPIYPSLTATEKLEPKNVVGSFFERYSTALIEEKLGHIFGSKAHVVPAVDSVKPTNDLPFCEDLLMLLQGVKQLQHCELLVAPSFSEQTLVCVEGVVNLIKQAIPVGAIYNLSKSKDELDLIVVLEKNCTRAYNEFDAIIDLSLLGYQNGTCTIHNYGMLNAQIKKGHFFYATACTESNLVYRKSTAELFPKVVFEQKIKFEVETRFKKGMQKAGEFQEGAHYYFANSQYEMTAFMLQQATELTYRCLLQVLRGRDVKCHAPAVLRKHLKRFAPEIIGVFSTDEEKELAQLQLLEEAYIKSRYDSNYQLDKATVNLLMRGVELLMRRTWLLFAQRLKVLDQLTAKWDDAD